MTKSELTTGHGKAIRSVVGDLEKASVNTAVENISDGVFDTKYLRSYRHPEELAECCREAIRELGSKPYCGRKSYAELMGRAMELLMERHGLPAPRGWVPVMKILR